jgi:FkbM family methyltransferase
MLNPFVYESIDAQSLGQPDIDVSLVRHFAQCAEDLIVASLLRALAAEHSLDLSIERYLEIGANHPIATSATYLLREEFGMRGVLVEANPTLIPDLQKVRGDDIIVNCAVITQNSNNIELFVSNKHEISSVSRDFVETWADGSARLSRVETVDAIRINALLTQYFNDRSPIFLSIDVEGLDFDLISDMDWRKWRPSIIQVEPSEHFIKKNATRIAEFLKTKGYFEVARTPVNQIFLDTLNPRAIRLPGGQGTVAPAGVNTQSSAPSVGIVTRTKNRTVLLRRALESVKNQTYGNWNLVVVNDGGDTEPVNWLVQQVFQADPRVRIIHHAKSAGMEAASNAGLAVLDTVYAVIHDDDDSWAPEFLASSIAALQAEKIRFPSIRGVVSKVNVVHESVHGNEIIINRVEPFKPWHTDTLEEGLLSVQKMLIRNQFPPIGFVFDLAAGRDLGLFDASLPVLGDWDFHTRFLLKHDVWVHDEYLSFYHHRVSASGALGNTVHSGASAHRLYANKIRNERIRAAAGGDARQLMLLSIPMEIQELTQSQFEHVLWRIWQLENGANAPPSGTKRALVALWERLPKRVQDALEPFANFIDRVVK